MKHALYLALAAAMLPALALATNPTDSQTVSSKAPAPSVVVHFGDLDLSTPQGVRRLHERLKSAALRVCAQMMPNPVSIEGGKCREQLVEAALGDINRQARLAYGQDAPILR